MNKKNGIYAFVALLVIVLIWVIYQAKRPGISSSAGDPNAKKAPDFTLQSLDGNSVSLKQFEGKNVVLLDFWATWCPPCRAAMPELAALEAKYESRGLKVISVNQGEDKTTVQNFVRETGYKPLVLLDPGSVGNMYGVRGIPTFVLVDKAGKLRHSQSGFAPGMGDDLGRRIEELLGS